MTTTLEIENIVCPACFAVLDAGDRFCRHCGAATSGDQPAVQPADALSRPCHCQVQMLGDSPAARPRWTDNPWVVLPVVFLVLGPIGIPMLWRSRRIAPRWKILVTIAVLGLTAFIAVMIHHSLSASLAPLQQLHHIRGL